MSVKLSVLDQSPIAEGKTPEKALEETVELAKRVEELGYQRFWVSEHHDTATLAGSSPEVLMSFLAANTSKIRVGSGGVMLPHYSSYKVAENMNVLATLAKGRVDVGVGRAPGGMPRATLALNNGNRPMTHQFKEQVEELRAYLHDDVDPNHPYHGLKATPVPENKADLWLLGSSPSSAELAAELGLPYTYAQFIQAEYTGHNLTMYKQQFKPSENLDSPYSMLAVFVLCGETEEEANYLASSIDLSLIQLEQGMPSKGTPDPEIASTYPYTFFEQQRVRQNRERMIVGTKEQVRDKLLHLQKQYDVDEFMLVTIMHDFEKRKRSYELVAEAMLEQ